jgi:glycerophosphoryl diester phosphodiesterase
MHPYFDLPRPHLFAHRGASGEAPENTLPAFERAVELGIPFLEMDCHATRDGEVVICHDATVARMTNEAGAVAGYSFAELSAIDAGYRFTPDGGASFPYRGRGVRIPRLSEVLEAFPQARINLEIKQAEPSITEEVLRVIRRAGAEERTLLAAAEDEIMAEIHDLGPGTAIGSSIGDVAAFYRALAAGTLDSFEPLGQALQIPPFFGSDPMVTPESVAAARRLGLLMHVWTINDPAQIRELLRAGVDGVMSDFPGLLVEYSPRT